MSANVHEHDAEGDSAQLDAEALSTLPRHKWAAATAEMFDNLAAAFRRAGYALEDASKLASIGISAISFALGGRVFYLPRGDTMKLALRDNAMFSAWRQHGDIPRLASDFGVTTPTAYRVIAQQRKLHKQARSEAGQ